MPLRRLALLALTAALPFAIGCVLPSESPLANAPDAAIAGRAMGGQQPVSASTISVWAVGSTGYGTGATQLASTTTDAGGNFNFAAGTVTCPYSNTPIYILASGGNPGLAVGTNNPNLVLGAALGPCTAALSANVTVNEVTTAALAFSLGQFFTPQTALGGTYTTDLFGGTCTACTAGTYNVGLVAASNNTYPTLVNNSAGLVNPSTATTTIESAKIYTIANILGACVNTAGQTSTSDTTTNCGQLFNNTKPASGARPLDTLQAAVQMSRIPYQNVAALYNLSPPSPAFGNALTSTPNDWTIGVSYTSAAFGLGINLDSLKSTPTTSNIDIDILGKVWFPTNTATSHGVATFDPASSSFSGPYASTVLAPQYLAIDRLNNIFVSDMRSGTLNSTPTTAPTLLGTNYIVPTSTATGPLLAYADSTSSLGFVSNSTSSQYDAGTVYLGTSASIYLPNAYTQTPLTLNYQSVTRQTQGPVNAPGTLSADSSLNAGCVVDITYNGGNAKYLSSGVQTTGACQMGGSAVFGSSNGSNFQTYAAVATYNGFFIQSQQSIQVPVVPLSAPQQIIGDGKNNFWLSNSGSASVSTFGTNFGANPVTTSTIPYLHGAGNGGTMTTPYGIAVDRSGNIWVSNAGCIATTTTVCTPGSFILSEIIGVAVPALTPLSATIYKNAPYSRLPTN